jgi:hypothetical protein
LPRFARILKPGTYGSLGYPPFLARKPDAVATNRLIVEAVLAATGVLCFTLLAAAFVRGGQVVSFDDDVSR